MISTNAKYWIWISQALGYNTAKIKKLFSIYPDISAFVKGGEKEWRLSGVLTQRDLEKLLSTKPDVSPKILSKCRKYGYSVLAIDDEKYPRCIMNIDTPPAVIYINGKFPFDIDSRLSIGVVGTRRASNYGISNSYKIAYALSKYGACIISGGDLGVDNASHRGSLAADGTTICVRGCGINYDYLRENKSMRDSIAENGAVISEYPPDYPPKKYNFPARNRLISAMSKGLLVIEAGKHSGSLITADLALEQGKDVFALVGDNSPQNAGSNERIKEGSAIAVTDFVDILNYYDSMYVLSDSIDLTNIDEKSIITIPVKGSIPKNISPFISNKTDNFSKPKKNKHKNNDIKIELSQTNDETQKNKIENSSKAEHKNIDEIDLDNDSIKIYNYLGSCPVHIDKISSELNIPVYKALTALTVLEMNNLVESVKGRRYVLK